MHVVIEGTNLPGRTFCDPDGDVLDTVHVGVQVRREPWHLVAGDAAGARWEIDVSVTRGTDGEIDFKGPAVHRRPGERFLYLTWGNVDGASEFHMFRRAKLMLNRIGPEIVTTAEDQQRSLVGIVNLTDSYGRPRCARVDPPDLVWTLI